MAAREVGAETGAGQVDRLPSGQCHLEEAARLSACAGRRTLAAYDHIAPTSTPCGAARVRVTHPEALARPLERGARDERRAECGCPVRPGTRHARRGSRRPRRARRRPARRSGRASARPARASRPPDRSESEPRTWRPSASASAGSSTRAPRPGRAGAFSTRNTPTAHEPASASSTIDGGRRRAASAWAAGAGAGGHEVIVRCASSRAPATCARDSSPAASSSRPSARPSADVDCEVRRQRCSRTRCVSHGSAGAARPLAARDARSRSGRTSGARSPGSRRRRARGRSRSRASRS